MKVLVALFALFISGLVVSAPLKNMVVFGDSLSDNGNLYEFMDKHVPISPPYFKGRFTNGPVWIELLTKAYFPTDGETRLLDYAFGGAGISEEAEEEALFTLKHEIDVYLLTHNDTADPQSLFVIWIGANNYLVVPEDNEKALNVVIKGIDDAIKRLIKKGAKNFLILNLPDLGKTPAGREFQAEERLSYLVKKHNAILAKMLESYKRRYPDIKWIHYDVYSAFNEIFVDPAALGFSNTYDTCYDEIIDKPSYQSIIKMASHVKANLHSDSCEGFLFFDPVHPTEPAHKIIAERISVLLDEAGIKFAQ